VENIGYGASPKIADAKKQDGKPVDAAQLEVHSMRN